MEKHLSIYPHVLTDYLESTDEFEPLRFAESVSENVLPSREFSVPCWFWNGSFSKLGLCPSQVCLREPGSGTICEWQYDNSQCKKYRAQNSLLVIHALLTSNIIPSILLYGNETFLSRIHCVLWWKMCAVY